MKKSILATSLALIIGGGALFAQQKEKKMKTEVPTTVLIAFHKDYPQVKNVDWDAEDGVYEADFKLNKQEISVTYSANGQKQETETEIQVNQLPPNAKAYILKNNLGKIKEAAKIVNADGTITYEAEVKKGDVMFDQNGNFLKLKEDND